MDPIQEPPQEEIEKLAQELYQENPEEDFDPKEGYTELLWEEIGSRQDAFRHRARSMLRDQIHFENWSQQETAANAAKN